MMSSEFGKSGVLSEDREEGRDGRWGPEWEARVHSVPVSGTGRGRDFSSGDQLHTKHLPPSADQRCCPLPDGTQGPASSSLVEKQGGPWFYPGVGGGALQGIRGESHCKGTQSGWGRRSPPPPKPGSPPHHPPQISTSGA